jgi:hypothetical protein
MRMKTKLFAAWTGLLLCSTAVALANTIVTFQVDMSTAGIDPNTATVSARGSFNGWNQWDLTNNPSGSEPYVYSGTTNVAANGSVMQYKYVINPGGWENIPKGNNRLVTLPTTSGASLVLPKVYYADIPAVPVTVDVTFQLDMAQQINVGAFDPLTMSVYPKGTWNGWGSPDVMTNDPTILRTNQFGLVTSNVYVYTYNMTRSPGETMDFKYYILYTPPSDSGYESPAPGTGDPADHNNRFLNLSEGPPQTLPIVFFSDAPYAPLATNDVTFQVDMTYQVVLGNFDPATGTVEVKGDINGWGTTQILCTNDLTALNTNLYKAVVRIADGVGARRYYKFWSSVPDNTGWETMADNRNLSIISGTEQTLPAVYFSDVIVDPNDYLPADTLVSFSVNMTNAMSYSGFTPEITFAKTMGLYVNGNWIPWWAWTAAPAVDFMMTNDTSGDWLYYSTPILVKKGKPVELVYKYGIDDGLGSNLNNEAPDGSDRVRYIRQTGSYTLPLDKFGTQTVEPSFGDLTIGTPSAGHVPISWLGRPGVFLQTASSVDPGATWTTHTETAAYGSASGIYSTNYPTTGNATFFRLVKP